MPGPDRRETAARTREADDGDLTLAQHGHVDRVGIDPQAEQRPLASRELIDCSMPSVFLHDQARPGMMRLDPPALNRLDERSHRFYPKSLATF